jgi:small subunit ribosomal protein S21
MRKNPYYNDFKRDFGLSVEVRNDNVEQALRKFKKKVNNDGKIQEYRERTEYTKPTTARKKARDAAKSRNRKRVAEESNRTKRLY